MNNEDKVYMDRDIWRIFVLCELVRKTKTYTNEIRYHYDSMGHKIIENEFAKVDTDIDKKYKYMKKFIDLSNKDWKLLDNVIDELFINLFAKIDNKCPTK